MKKTSRWTTTELTRPAATSGESAAREVWLLAHVCHSDVTEGGDDVEVIDLDDEDSDEEDMDDEDEDEDEIDGEDEDAWTDDVGESLRMAGPV